MTDAPDDTPQPIAYCSTRDAAQRIGVSLGTVQQMVEAGLLEAWKTVGGHRRIRVDSVERFVAQRDGAGGARTARIEPAVGRAPRLKVLVAEDDALVREVYEHAFRKWALDMDWSFVEDGFSGLVSIGRSAPDVLVSDLMMPGMDGFEMIRRLRADPALDAMDIVVVSALDADQVAERGGLPQGVIRWGKPIPLPELKGYLQARTHDRRRELPTR
jgi:excisionase family DNA binding protein